MGILRKNRRGKRPDDVSGEFPDGAIKLVTEIIPARAKNDVPTIVFDGDATTLEYLGRLFLAQATYRSNCGFGISPVGAGSSFFVKGSQVGIYIHRQPCLDPTGWRSGVRAAAQKRDSTRTTQRVGKRGAK